MIISYDYFFLYELVKFLLFFFFSYFHFHFHFFYFATVGGSPARSLPKMAVMERFGYIFFLIKNVKSVIRSFEATLFPVCMLTHESSGTFERSQSTNYYYYYFFIFFKFIYL